MQMIVCGILYFSLVGIAFIQMLFYNTLRHAIKEYDTKKHVSNILCAIIAVPAGLEWIYILIKTCRSRSYS